MTGGFRTAPYDKIHCTDCVDVVKLSVTLIGLTIKQMLCLISGTSGKHLPEVTTSGKAANSLLGRHPELRLRKTLDVDAPKDHIESGAKICENSRNRSFFGIPSPP